MITTPRLRKPSLRQQCCDQTRLVLDVPTMISQHIPPVLASAAPLQVLEPRHPRWLAARRLKQWWPVMATRAPAMPAMPQHLLGEVQPPLQLSTTQCMTKQRVRCVSTAALLVFTSHATFRVCREGRVPQGCYEQGRAFLCRVCFFYASHMHIHCRSSKSCPSCRCVFVWVSLCAAVGADELHGFRVARF